eukprot:5649685-Pyramimonas_sp.AAC.2
MAQCAPCVNCLANSASPCQKWGPSRFMHTGLGSPSATPVPLSAPSTEYSSVAIAPTVSAGGWSASDVHGL